MNIGYTTLSSASGLAQAQKEIAEGDLTRQANRLLALAEELAIATAHCESHTARLGYRPSDQAVVNPAGISPPEPSSHTVSGQIELAICRISGLSERLRILGNDLAGMI